ETVAANPDKELESVLAGYVLDRFNKPVANGAIRVIDLQEPEEQSKLDVVLSDGQFWIPKLKAGHNYKLIARAKDGQRLLAGNRRATAPNARIAIVVSEDLVGPDTPPLPGPIVLPGQTPPAADKEAKPSRGAELGAPIRPNPDGRIDNDPL